jgi:hypothetical protein
MDDDKIIIRYYRTGKDAHDWGFIATKKDWRELTGYDEPDEVDQMDCARPKFDEILDFPEATDDPDSPYVVRVY